MSAGSPSVRRHVPPRQPQKLTKLAAKSASANTSTLTTTNERTRLRHDDEPAFSHQKPSLPHKSSSSHTLCSKACSTRRFPPKSSLAACPRADIFQPDAASSDRLPLGATSPWAWLLPSRPIGQRTRPLGVAWSRGNHPPKLGPHLFSPWTHRERFSLTNRRE